MILQDRTRWRDSLIVIAGFGLVVLAENIVYLIGTGQFNYRLHIVKSVSGGVMNPEYAGTQLWIFPKAWFITFYEVGLYYYLLFAAFIWAIIKKQRALLLLLIWVGVYLFWLQFGGNPFAKNYSVKSHLVRYLSMINIPVAVVVGYFLWYFVKRLWMRTAVLSIVVLSSLFFINFNKLSLERFQAAKLGIEYARTHNLFPIYMDHTSLPIAEFLLRGNKHANQIFPAQKHSFRSGKTEIVAMDNVDGYLLLARDSMQYTSRRYFMEQLDIDWLKSQFDVVYTVSNPINSLAYQQARLFVYLANLLPNDFLREKIADTGSRLLKDEDVLIFELSSRQPD